MTRTIAPSELIVNSDGSVFHLHLRPEQLARTVILVGDPGRVEQVASRFDRIEHRAANREFVTATGYYAGKRMTVLSTGIGTDNIDIVVNELDALVNIDLRTRTEKRRKPGSRWSGWGPAARSGPSCAGRPDSLAHIGRAGRPAELLRGKRSGLRPGNGTGVRRTYRLELAARHPLFRPLLGLSRRAVRAGYRRGHDRLAPGFYAPQGRYLRLAPADRRLNEKIESFEYGGHRFTNFEMEGSALAGLSRLMGHDAVTICTVIAQRVALESDTDYRPFVDKMIATCLEKLVGI